MKNIYARVMVLVHDTSSQCALQMYEVSLYICNGYQVIEWTRFYNYLCYKGDNLKIHMHELWFLCMTRRVNELYKCMKFH